MNLPLQRWTKRLFFPFFETFDRSINLAFFGGEPPEVTPLRIEEEEDILKLKKM